MLAEACPSPFPLGEDVVAQFDWLGLVDGPMCAGICVGALLLLGGGLTCLESCNLGNRIKFQGLNTGQRSLALAFLSLSPTAGSIAVYTDLVGLGVPTPSPFCKDLEADLAVRASSLFVPV